MLPLSFLACFPQGQINLDRKLLQSAEALTSYAKDFTNGPTYARPSVGSFDAKSVSAEMQSALEIPVAVKLLGAARGAYDYQSQWSSSNEEGLKAALAAKPIATDAPTASAVVLQGAVAERQRLTERDIERRDCLEPQTNQNSDSSQPGSRNRRSCPRGPTDEEYKQIDAKIESLKANVAEEKAAQVLAEEARLTAAANIKIDDAFGRIRAMKSASAQASIWFKSVVYSVISFLTLLVYISVARFHSFPTLITAMLSCLAIAAWATDSNGCQSHPNFPMLQS